MTEPRLPLDPTALDPATDVTRAVEATLFAAAEPLSVHDIAAYVGPDIDVKAALATLADLYATRGVTLVERGGKWHFQTASDLAHILRREREETRKLSRAGIETLAIIAYHEPVSRAEIEAIRGVQISKGTLDVLMEAGWVRPAGRRESRRGRRGVRRGRGRGGGGGVRRRRRGRRRPRRRRPRRAPRGRARAVRRGCARGGRVRGRAVLRLRLQRGVHPCHSPHRLPVLPGVHLPFG